MRVFVTQCRIVPIGPCTLALNPVLDRAERGSLKSLMNWAAGIRLRVGGRRL